MVNSIEGTPSGNEGRLRDEIVVVTGGSNGIGEATVTKAVSEGARVAVFDIVPPNFAVGDRTRFFEVDVTDSGAIADAFAELADSFAPVTILVNNAGQNTYSSVEEMGEQDWESFFALDLKAAWLCSKFAVPHMRKTGMGSIVNIASVHAHMTAEGFFPYAAAKSGLLGLTRSMALDLGPAGIRVNSVSPGYTQTRLVEEQFALLGGNAQRREVEERHALRRMGLPSEVAAVVCFLASREASFVTGADWIVDGGISARFA